MQSQQARLRAEHARELALERAVAYKAKLLRLGVHAQYLQLLWVTAVATVLVTRALLAATGYPQLAGGSIHFAHALWGGLLMSVGLVAALILIGPSSRAIISVVGGVGLGLFVDEVGKFITKTNDYFFRPAAAIIYVLFAGLLLLTIRVKSRQPNDPLSAAAAIAADGAIDGLTPRQRKRATEWLSQVSSAPTASALQNLVDVCPERKGWQQPAWMIRLENRARAIAQSRYVIGLGIVLMIGTSVLLAGFFFGDTDVTDKSPTGIAQNISSISRLFEAATAVVGGIRWLADHKKGYRWLYVAIFSNLYVTQIFNLTNSPFAALAELPFLGLFLAALREFQDSVEGDDEDLVGPQPGLQPSRVAEGV